MTRTLSLVTLGVSDLAASRSFYERTGWRVADCSNEFIVFLHGGGAALALYPRDALLEDCGLAGDHPAPGGVTLACNVGSREEVDERLAQAVAAGGRLIAPPREKPWGYGGYFADPDGHPWEVAHVPSLALDAAGRILFDA